MIPLAGHNGNPDLTLPASSELIAAAKREMISAPVNDSAMTTRLIGRLDTLREFTEGLTRGIEQFTMLNASELQVLNAISNDVSHPRHIGRRVGMEKEVVTACLLVLEEKGFIAVVERIGDRIIDVVISDQGHAALAQAEAVKFRSLDALLKQSPNKDVNQLLQILDEATLLATRIALQLAGSDEQAPFAS